MLQLSRIIYLFSTNMHDASLSLSIHTTCARLMLNLVLELSHQSYNLLAVFWIQHSNIWFCMMRDYNWLYIWTFPFAGWRWSQFLRRVLINHLWMKLEFYWFEISVFTLLICLGFFQECAEFNDCGFLRVVYWMHSLESSVILSVPFPR